MSETRDLQVLLDGARAAVVSTDREYRVKYLNAAAAEQLNTPESEVVGHPVWDWISGEYNSIPVPRAGWRVQRLPDGWAFFADGTPGTEPLLQRLLEAEQLAAVGQLAASVAHEIGAPLTAIIMSVEQLLKRECGSCGIGTRDLRIVLEQTQRISRLTRRLVDLARPGTPELERVDLNSVVRDLMELMDKQLKRSNIVVELELDGSLPLVFADVHQLQQVLLNLVLNAEHALSPGGGRLSVQTRRTHKWIELRVTDTGRGIDPEDVAKVFLPFFSRSGGTGLGLAMVRQIVHGHGGTVEVESTPGRGALFTVRLPEGSND